MSVRLEFFPYWYQFFLKIRIIWVPRFPRLFSLFESGFLPFFFLLTTWNNIYKTTFFDFK